jgi:hypothetical protein
MKHSLILATGLCLLSLPIATHAVEELPADFPGLTVTTYNEDAVGEGYIFLAVASETEGIGTYLMVLENDGSPLWYQKVDTHEIYDFKVQPNGYLTYAPFIHAHTYTGGGDATHDILDDTYNLRETVTGGNRYVAESHDFQILPNGHVLQFGYYMSEVDMSQIVDGGNPGALVSGGVVQELDNDRNVVFQWRTWDYYRFEDATYGRGSTSATISAFHLNTINQDPDGNIILGTPIEIRKLNRQTGEVLWVLGGDENEFEVAGEGADVSHFGGHATYRLENGNFLMYDNGPRRGSGTSTIHEYHLDEVNKIATHVWSWAPSMDIQAWHRGNAQRLPNGNTLIGWGGASGDHIPVATEVSPDGEVVFELYFDEEDPQVESYRAFRFPYPPRNQRTQYFHYELAAGNEYEFTDTGTTLDVETVEGDGYNEVSVTRAPYAPVYPEFAGKAPRILPVRIALGQYGIRAMTGRISFDTQSLGHPSPGDLTIYQRESRNEGQFTALATDYNPVIGQLRANISGFGEFVFGYPDLEDVPFSPLLNRVESDRGVQETMVIAPRLAEDGVTYLVNEDLPVSLSWSPKGFARGFDLQVAGTPDFAEPVVDVNGQHEAYYVWEEAPADSVLYYRVRTLNEGGTSDWSVGSFRTASPMIAVIEPNGGEAWDVGLEQYIRWEDNLAEDVVIELHRDGELVDTIGTVPSNGVHEWEVPLDAVPGSGYTIRIISTEDAELVGESGAPFGIGLPRIVSIEALGSGSFSLEWSGAVESVYVDFSPTIQPAAWEEVAGPITESPWQATPEEGSQAGYYRLRAE